jgi:hypothetical protein
MQFDVDAMSRAIRFLMDQGLSYEEAARRVAASTAKASVVPEAATSLPGQEPGWVSAMSGAEVLADGLTGAPQDDIAPEPMAKAAKLPPGTMTQADIDYVNSLPQNSPEAMARKQRRWEESDGDMADLESRLRSATGADATEAELEALRNGGIPPSFDPGSLGDDERLPSVSSARPQSYSNPNTFDPMAQADPRQSFRDFERAEGMRRRSQGVPVEAQRERDFASGQYGDFDQRLQDQARWAQSMQIDPEGRGIGPNAFQRRYNPKESRAWYDQNVVPRIREQAQGELAAAQAKQRAERDTPLASSQWNTGPNGATNLRDAKLERADLERRVKTYANQNGLKFADALEQLSADPNSPFNALKQSLPGDKYSALERASSKQHRMNYVKNPEAILAARNPEKAERMRRLSARNMLLGNDPRQNAANAFLALGEDGYNDRQKDVIEQAFRGRGGIASQAGDVELEKARIAANATVDAARAQAEVAGADRNARLEESRLQHQEKMAAFEAERLAADTKAQADAAAEKQRMELMKQQHIERMAAQEAEREAAAQRAEQARLDGDAKSQEANRRHEQMILEMQKQQALALKQIEAAIARANIESASRERISAAEVGVKSKVLEAETKQAEELEKQQQQLRRQKEAVELAGPGGVDIVREDYGTPMAQDSFRKLARAADDSWWGFYDEDGDRLNSLLIRLGISDPQLRSDLVNKYGFSNKDGRSSLFSRLLGGRRRDGGRR